MEIRIIQALRRPACFPDLSPDPEKGDEGGGGRSRTRKAEAEIEVEIGILQTHLSIVCLAGDRVYKLKKPERLAFVDYSTLERRRFFCGEEVRLNRRLCPDVYLGVAVLRRSEAGDLRFGPVVEPERPAAGEDDGGSADGGVIDWAVVMRRLPAERMLDQLIRNDAVAPRDMDALAEMVVRFHQGVAADAAPARSDAVRRAADPSTLARLAGDNFRETAHETSGADGGIFDRRLHEEVARRTESAFDSLLPALEERRRRGLVVEGHGDLHCRNICLVEPPVIYDCIEFSEEFRCGDTALENAFLVMDLIHRGRPDLAARYLERYVGISRDDGQSRFMPPLIAYRAMVRAKVDAIAAREPEMDPDQRAQSAVSARRHLNLAAAALLGDDGPRSDDTSPPRPIALVACGLPGSGKSRVFAEFSDHCGWRLWSSDRIRKAIVGIRPDRTAPAEAYTNQVSEEVYRRLIEAAVTASTESLGRARHPRLSQLPRPALLLDANFPTRPRRRAAVAALREAGADPVIVWFDPPRGEIRERLAARRPAAEAASDADWDVFLRLEPRFEPPVDPAREAAPVVRLTDAMPPECQAAGILAALLGLVGRNTDEERDPDCPSTTQED